MEWWDSAPPSGFTFFKTHFGDSESFRRGGQIGWRYFNATHFDVGDCRAPIRSDIRRMAASFHSMSAASSSSVC